MLRYNYLQTHLIFLKFKHFKVKLGGLTDHTVAMVTRYVEKITITCSPVLMLVLVSLLLHQLIKSGSIGP